ncbi:MAG: PilZ domain-containing protein [Spirochaetaceae bacterium]
MKPILLQAFPPLASSDTPSIIIGIGILLFFIIFLVIASRGGASGGSSGQQKKFSKRKFRKIASSRGLNKGETHYLESMIKKSRVANPYQLLQNSRVLDSALKRALLEIEHSEITEPEKEAQKFVLYRIKQKLERNTKGVKPPNSTRQLRLGQPVTIAVDDNRYQSKVTSNMQKSLGLKIPTDDHGNEVRWKKWSKATVFFWRSNGQGFSFQTKIIGYNVVRGISSIFVQHSNSIKEAQQWRYRRRELGRPCYFYPIKVVTSGSGKNARKQAIVENKRGTLGTILEVSAGGCSIRTTYPLAKGELIKNEFETEKGMQVTSFGKIRSMTRIHPTGGIMHVMFTRVSRQNVNKINQYVYSFDRDQENRRPRL